MLASVMHVNNEIGVIQDIAAIGDICRSRGMLFHVDAAQATGKVAIDLDSLPVDLMSFSAHKTYGPKGIGALYVRRKPRVRIEAQMHGGGHERGMRSGTLRDPPDRRHGRGLPARARRDGGGQRTHPRLRDKLLAGLSILEETYVNGDLEARVPHNLNISFNFVEGESLIMAMKDIAVSSGSACTSASLEPSYVLRALGAPTNWRTARSASPSAASRPRPTSTPRSTWSRATCSKLRDLSPLWDMHMDGVDLSNGAVGRPLKESRWHTATKSWIITKTRATSARSTRTIPASAPAWSAHRPAATS